MIKDYIYNISFFANTGIGEFGTKNITIHSENKNDVSIKTIIANELLAERADIYKLNYPDTKVVAGSITDNIILKELIKLSYENNPITATVSPPCQGSSGLNAFKNQPYDFRNQLIKSFFKYLNAYNEIEYGYIENVISYYSAEIPGILNNSVFWEYVINDKKQILNYPYFLLFKHKETFNKIKEKYLKISEESGQLSEKIDNYNYFIALNNLEDFAYLNDNNDVGIIEPINMKEYIYLCFKKLGYQGQLDWVRGDEYGAPQIRQRGFYVFYKKSLSSKMSFPQPIFNTIKDKNYLGKTILDALLANKLLEEVSSDYESESEFQIAKSSAGKFYKDTALSKQDFENLLKTKHAGESIAQSEMHFKDELSKRYKIWVENTPEGSSCYFNKQRIHRPYKIIEVSANKIKNNRNFVVEEDNPLNPLWFYRNGVIDYQWFLTQAIKDSEKDFNSKSNKSRYWQIQNSITKKNITQMMTDFALALLEDDYNSYNKKHNMPEIDNELRGRFAQMSKKEIYYLFLPIKGFEQATYKRASLSRPSSALTTKMNIGNSNTLHPIFDRTWTPQEVMVLFGLGFVLEDDKYVKIQDYKMPIDNKTNATRLANMVYEICGEGIISTVAQEFLKQLTQQYLNK